jgi:hypothetical protein
MEGGHDAENTAKAGMKTQMDQVDSKEDMIAGTGGIIGGHEDDDHVDGDDDEDEEDEEDECRVCRGVAEEGYVQTCFDMHQRMPTMFSLILIFLMKIFL